MKNKPRLSHFNQKVIEVNMEKYEQRLKICETCYARDKNICKIINEPYTARASIKSGSCPQGFWTSYYGN